MAEYLRVTPIGVALAYQSNGTVLVYNKEGKLIDHYCNRCLMEPHVGTECNPDLILEAMR